LRVQGGSYDFGARNYDSRIGRWISVDPLANKYPNQTPYGYVGNSPIVNKENGGRDYGVYVDHDKHTIDIKATFYTVAGDAASLASATKAAQFWNDQRGNFKYVVGKGSGAVEYSVKFTMSVVPVSDPKGEMRNDHEQWSPENRRTKDKSSNTYSVKPDKDPVFDNAKKEEDTRGATKDGNEISVKESEQKSDVGEHEMGHAIGLGHFFRGVMTANLIDPDHALTISVEYVRSILQNALTAIKDMAKGDLFQKGDSPKDFGKGKMVETKQH
jgi:RHS repeat-associated protein